MATLEFAHIHKRYGNDIDAVRDFNLKIEDGEFVVLVGPSGCGKTTLLRMVAGLESITAGELMADGRVINDVEPQNRNVAMVFQNYALFPNMTVAENIGFALKMKRVPKKERQSKVLAMAKILDIEDLLDRKAKKLSGGQCQRIAIGRALVCEPQFFLLDEPLSNLDAQMRMQLREEIAKLQRDTGVTTLYVTHDQVEAMSLGSKIVVMNHGVIQQADTPQNIYYKPANTFVARYIGQRPMNIFTARCIETDSGMALETDEGIIQLPEWKAAILDKLGYGGKTVKVGVRCENIYLTEEDGRRDTDGALLPLSVQVNGVEILGSSVVAHFGVNGENVAAEFRTSRPIMDGENLEVWVVADRLHIFDEESLMAVAH